MSHFMPHDKPRNAAQLIKACMDFPVFGALCFESFYVTGRIVKEYGIESIRDLEARMETPEKILVEAERDLAVTGIHINDTCPIIVEDRAWGAASELLHNEALVIKKDDARNFTSLLNPMTLISDNAVIVEIDGQEPALVLVLRDNRAPTPEYKEACNGGWVGPADLLRTAKVKLDGELGFILPGRNEGEKPMTCSQLADLGMAHDVTDRFAPHSGVRVTAASTSYPMRFLNRRITAAPFFHLAAKPDFKGDANMLNLLRVVRVRLPKGSEVVDTTGWNDRNIELVPLSQLDRDRGRTCLPTVNFVTEKLDLRRA